MRIRTWLPWCIVLAMPVAFACGERRPAATPSAAASGSADDGDLAETAGSANAGRPAITGNARALYDQGVAAYLQGDLPRAAQAFQQAITAEPKAFEAHHALGATYERMGKTSDALESYRNAYKLNPSYGIAIASYGFLLYRQGSKTEAETFLTDQQAKNPKSLPIMTALAEIKSLQGDSSAAQSLAGNALTVDAKYEPAMVLIARDHYRSGRVDLAGYVLAAILDGQKTQEEREKNLPAKTNPPRAPENPEAHMLRGILLQRQGERLGAAKWYESATKHRPDLVEAQLQLGLIRLESNDAEGARSPLEKAVAFANNRVEGHLALGEAYRLTSGRAADAKREYQWVLGASGASAQLKALAQYDLGLLYFLNSGIDGLSDVARYDRAVEYWNQYKAAKGTAAGPSWPADVDDLIEQARRARSAASAAGTGGGTSAPKSAPAASAPAGASSAPTVAPGGARPASSAPPATAVPAAPAPRASASTR